MRDIIFRAKRTDSGEWVEGYYAHLSNGKKQSDRIYTGYAETDCEDFYPDWYEVDPCTVCEWTGLVDKNGNKIWENDILRQKKSGVYGLPFFVIFDDGSFMWRENKRTDFIYQSICDTCEIISNVFDNPDLVDD